MNLGDPKWQMPGWRIEQRYSTGVLIGNWSEDRLGKFQRGQGFRNSTNREDYQFYSTNSYRPDVSVRRKGLLRSDGLAKDQIFTHHGKRYMHNNISLYDQQFNRRHSLGSRSWDRHKMSWQPEGSDHPLQGKSTNFGLKEAIAKKWAKLAELEAHGDFATSYSATYRPPSLEDTTSTKRQATSRHLSVHLHPHQTNKDLHLRGKPLIIKPEVVDPKLLQKKLTSTV